MSSFPFATHRIEVLTVERPKPALTARLRANGYRYHCHSVGADNRSLRADDEVWLHADAHVTAARAASVSNPGGKHMPPVRCDVLYAGSALAMQQWRSAGAS